MKPKTYRRVTRGLFCFLFLMFFLLYLLLRNGMGIGSNGGWGGGELTRDLGTVALSEVRSSGFIVDEFAFPGVIRTDASAFNQNVVTAHALLLNEGQKTIRVSINIHGTKIEGKNTQGLCGGFYYYKGDLDPVSGDYAKYIKENKTNIQISSFEENNMVLYVNPSKYPAEIILNPGEQIYLTLFCWVDQAVVPSLTEEQRKAYSVTVKLVSRTA